MALTEKLEAVSEQKKQNEYIETLIQSQRYSGECIDLIRSDLAYGLTIEQVQRYHKQKKYSESQMRLYSKALRDRVPDEVLDILFEPKLSEEQMRTGLEFYQKKVPISRIQEIISGDVPVDEMRMQLEHLAEQMEQTEKMIPPEPAYVKELGEEIKSIVAQITEQRSLFTEMQKFISQFQSKEKEQFEAKLKEAEAERISLQEQIKEREEQIAKMEKEIVVLKEQMQVSDAELRSLKEEQQKEPEKAVERKEQPMAEPVQAPLFSGGYSYALMDPKGQVVTHMMLERPERRKNDRSGIFAALTFKKRSRRDLVKLLSAGTLVPEQLAQIKVAMEKGLTEGQLLELINNNVSADRMKGIIEIAVLENCFA